MRTVGPFGKQAAGYACSLVAIALLLSGCTAARPEQSGAGFSPATGTDSLLIVALGASNTYGKGVSRADTL